jgi:S-formylglutathione hydrolase FrmB
MADNNRAKSVDCHLDALWHAALILVWITTMMTDAPAADHDTATAKSGKGEWVVVANLSGPTVIVNHAKSPTSGRMLVYLPEQYRQMPEKHFPLVVALHGWNQKPEEWRENTRIALFADSCGLIVAFPDMGKTVYEYQYYPESVIKWNAVPGARWIGEAILPYCIKNYRTLDDVRHRAIIGVSTGGRGAVVVAEHFPQFSFCASLSGTYDLSLLAEPEGEYKIHAAVFGGRKDFPLRWTNENCVYPDLIRHLADVDIFVAHGADDKVVNPNQAQAFKDILAEMTINNQVIIVPGAGHSWQFWDTQLPLVFKQFETILIHK